MNNRSWVLRQEDRSPLSGGAGPHVDTPAVTFPAGVSTPKRGPAGRLSHTLLTRPGHPSGASGQFIHGIFHRLGVPPGMIDGC